jgi:hypothetical protein
MARDLLLMLLLVVTIGAYVVIQGARVDRAEARAAAAATQNTRLQAELVQARGSVQVVTQYVDRVQIIRQRGETITREIPAHVTPQADTRCPVSVGFVSVHDAAAANLPLDRPAGDPDAPAPGLALSAVAATVVDNYGTCHELRAQVIGLQDYVGVLQAASP